MQVNLALTPTLATLRAATPRIQELRPALAQLLDFNLAAVDELSDAVLGLEHTHAEVMARAHPSNELEDLNREALQTRDRFLHDQVNLSKNGLIDRCLLGSYSGVTGYKAVVTDIRTCLAVHRRIGQAAAAKSCCNAADVERAEAVLRRMERLIGERNLGRKSTHEWIDLRARAFTLALHDYAEGRRGVTYLRWHHDDADSFAPSLYKGRIKKRRAAARPRPQPEVVQPPPAPQPVIGPNGPFVPAIAEPAASTEERIPGMPGGSPFLQGEGLDDSWQQQTPTGQ